MFSLNMKAMLAQMKKMKKNFGIQPIFNGLLLFNEKKISVLLC